MENIRTEQEFIGKDLKRFFNFIGFVFFVIFLFLFDCVLILLAVVQIIWGESYLSILGLELKVVHWAIALIVAFATLFIRCYIKRHRLSRALGIPRAQEKHILLET